MKPHEKALISKKTAERFAKNPFAKKMKKTLEARQEGGEIKNILKGIPDYLRRK